MIPLNCWFRAAPRGIAQVVGLSFYDEHSGAAAVGYILGYNKDQPPLRFLPVKSEFSSGNSFECPPALGSLMNPSVKSERVRDSFCLGIFGESVTWLTASLPKKPEWWPCAGLQVCLPRWARCWVFPKQRKTLAWYVVLLSSDQTNVRACLPEALLFVSSKLTMSHSSKRLVDPRAPCLLRPLLFQEHQPISPAFRKLNMLSFYFSLIKGPWPLVLHW